MASQNTKVIDVTRGFVPVDPTAFPNNYNPITSEDGKEPRKEIVPYEGYNFMPTSYGYKSFFGTTSKLDIDALTSRVDEVFIVQTNTYLNIAVALCEDGIWTKQADEVGAWVHSIILPVPAVGVHYDWSKCTLGNAIFCYRAGAPSYYKFSSKVEGSFPANEFFAVTPTFLNMEGQIGIFKAGGRLGFFDSENSTAWSSIDDYADFTPSITTLAGSSIFLEVQGRIVNILSYGDGFIIYSTKSIIYIARDEQATFQWNPVVLLSNAGIAFKRECCFGNNVSTQFAYTSVGLVKIEKAVATILVPEVMDFLKDNTKPIFLTLLEGRYLFLQVLDADYLNGLVSFTVVTIPSSTINYPPSSPPPPNPGAEGTIGGMLDGSNQDLQDLIDKYLLDNGLPTRDNNIPYTPLVVHEVNDSAVFRPMSEVMPSFGQTFITSNTKEVADIIPHLAQKASDNTIYSTLNIPNIPIRGFRPNSPTSPHPPMSGVFPQYISKLGCKGTPYIAPAIPMLPPDTTGWELATLINYQKNIWDINEFNVMDILNYISHHDSTGYDIGAMGLNPYIPGDLNINDIYPNSGTTTYLGIMETKAAITSFHNPLFTVDTWWAPAVVQMVGNEVSYSRQRTQITSMWHKVTINNHREAGASPDYVGDYWLYTYTHEIYGLTANTELLPDNPIQKATATITGFNYTDPDGTAQFVPWDSSMSPGDIPPFIYTGGGSITLPPSSFLLQDGSIGPVYPTIPGALVYDLELKKWGKMKVDHKVLVDWSPLNNLSGDIIPHEVFGITGGIVQPDGKIALFDKYPVDSYIKYGKIGYFRQGFTSAQEVRISFRSMSQGTIRTEASLDGTSVELGLTKTTDFTPAMGVVHYPSTSARWHTISIIGNYDIKHLEFRGMVVGNR